MSQTEVKALSANIEQNPHSAELYYQRGILLGGTYIESDESCGQDDVQDVHQAIRDFEKVIELSPNNANAYYHKACLYFALDLDDAHAMELLEKGNELDKENVDILIKYTEIITYDGENSHYAASIMKKVLATKPSLTAFFLQGNYLKSCAEYDVLVGSVESGQAHFLEAIAMFNRAIEMDNTQKYKERALEMIDECRAQMA